MLLLVLLNMPGGCMLVLLLLRLPLGDMAGGCTLLWLLLPLLLLLLLPLPLLDVAGGCILLLLPLLRLWAAGLCCDGCCWRVEACRAAQRVGTRSSEVEGIARAAWCWSYTASWGWPGTQLAVHAGLSSVSWAVSSS
jgi:hypothetical protein